MLLGVLMLPVDDFIHYFKRGYKLLVKMSGCDML